MENPQQLWSLYRDAIKSGNTPLAQAILKKIQNFSTYPTNRSGCSSCRRRL